MTYRIYLVEDEPNLNRMLAAYLAREGWEVTPFERGEAALAALEPPPDLWILDIMLPDIDGFALIRDIKSARPLLPVIFISARDQDLDRIVGLEMGSDDYLAKPFMPRELVIRARKLLERAYGARVRRDPGREEAAAAEGDFPLSPYRVSPAQRSIWMADERIDVTSKEFDLVCYLAEHAGQALSREQVLAAVWGGDYFGSDRVVDDLMRRVRRKMPELRVETLYGYGYRLVNP